MKKIKTLALAALPIATVGATTIALASCSKDDGIRTMSWDDAKAWVKTTWGEGEGKEMFPQNATSTWNFSGEITTRKTPAESEIHTYQAYFKNHVPNFIRRLGFLSEATYYTPVANTVSFEENSTTFIVDSAKEFTSDVEFTKDSFYKTLTADNFDGIFADYFVGTTGKKYTKFIIDTNTKTMKATGIFYAVSAVANGYDILSMPDFTISFGSKGQMLGVEFNFGKYTEAEYIWYSTVRADYSDWFDFTLNEGGKITIEYNYAK